MISRISNMSYFQTPRIVIDLYGVFFDKCGSMRIIDQFLCAMQIIDFPYTW